MRDRGLSDRTVCGNYQNVLAVLRFTGLDPQKLKFPPPPKYELKLPTVYTSVQLKRLFAEANEYERMAFQILLKLGLREQELMYAEFSDIDFEAKVFRVQGKEQYDFKVKDHEQREIPMPDDLVEALKIWKERHPGQSLILLTANDIPDGDLCHRVKMLAKRAGLECGTCKTCRKCAATAASSLTFTSFAARISRACCWLGWTCVPELQPRWLGPRVSPITATVVHPRQVNEFHGAPTGI
jgi:integrase